MIRLETLNDRYPKVRLDDVVEFLDHKRKPVTKKDRVPGPYPYYGANGQQDSVDGYIFDEPLVLLAEDGGYFGDPDRTIAYQVEGKCWVNNHAHVLRPTKKIDIRYLCRHLEKYDVVSSVNGATRAKLNKSAAKEIIISLPPLEEQKRIAAILDKADALRRKREKSIALTDDLLRSVFIDMFGDPVTNPKGWERKPLGDCTFIDAPMVDPKNEEFRNMLHVGADRIQKNTGKILDCLTAEEENLISNKFLFDENYLLYTKIRPYLKKVALPDFKGLCSADIYPVRPDTKLLTKEFLWYVLISDAFVSYTESLPSRANIPKINRKEFANYNIMLPPRDIQEQYSKLFLKTLHQTKVKEAALSVSCDLFSSLTQRAFRGELTARKEAA